jgi:hypothetical protein
LIARAFEPDFPFLTSAALLPVVQGVSPKARCKTIPVPRE